VPDDGVSPAELASGARRDTTVAAVEQLVRVLPSRGFRLVTISELFR